MQKKELKLESALRIGETTLVPVVEIRSTCLAGQHGISFSCRKQPIALLTLSPIGKKAFNMTGEEMSFSEFLSQFPGIEQALHALESGWAQGA